jgi:hypothetical protein
VAFVIGRLERIESQKMSKDAAKMIMEVVTKNIAEQDDVLIRIRPLCSESEFSEYRRMIGKSMGEMVTEIMHPIIAKYPELKPPQLK